MTSGNPLQPFEAMTPGDALWGDLQCDATEVLCLLLVVICDRGSTLLGLGSSKSRTGALEVEK